ncbi:PREDICTED: uncharacterized protein LOC109207840 [Nicotiana attenuata]|uniref:uncharacterized protein LOC109207840 n=1 Tax=Nicotiana attenuata TaxID=49451 RepID=UPI00090538B2|nr:PREDICTED: uncharacterized protein LOC109207840 [Nicotiana attenuata]
MRTPDVGTSHEGHDIFRECLAGIKDGPDPDASFIFDEAHRLFKQDVTLHKESFSKSRAELARCEVELKKISKERDGLKTLYVKKDEEISDLRAEPAEARQEWTELVEEVQQKSELVQQLREELKMKEAETLGWRQGMGRLASEKDTLREQLASNERHLQSVKEESLARSRKIEELEAKSAVELANSWAKEISAAAKVKLSCALDHARRQSRRETLKDVYARGFNLSADIKKAKSLEEEAVTLLSVDKDSASGSESGGDEDEVPEGEVPEGKAPEGAAAKVVALE